MKLLRIFQSGHQIVSGGLLLCLVLQLLGSSVWLAALAPLTAEAAVVTIDSTTSTTARSNNSVGTQTVFVTDQTGYAFYRDRNGQCVYAKTIDAGDTWGSAVVVDSQTDCIRIVVWYDRWTPGDTGSMIHIMTMDTSEDDLFYNRLDTTSDTLLLGSSAVSASASSGQTPTFSAAINLHTLTKATDGTLYAAVNDNGDSYAISCAAACNVGASWTEVGTSPFDTRNDHNVLMPLAGGSVLVINRDISANVIRSKIWNGASWSASWTLVASNVAESSEYDGGMAASLYQATGDIYLAFTADNGNLTDSNDDIRTAIYAGGSWSSMSDVLTNDPGRGLIDVAMGIDQNNGHAYVAYTIQATGGTANTASIYYKRSLDGMTSWEAETGPINTTPGDIRKPALDSQNADRLYVTWWEASVDDRFGDTLANIGPDTLVAATGTQLATVRASSSAVYLGGAFSIVGLVPNTLSGITLTETGTIDASTGLANVALYYDLDTTSPYDCQSESYDGTEPQFGATDTDGFSGANGTSTFTGSSVTVSATQALCGYVVTDVLTGAGDGATIDVVIANPVTDLTITGTDPAPATAVALPGTTTVVSADVGVLHYHWRADDGSETTATSLTGGAQDTALSALAKTTPVRLRFGVSAEGSTTSEAINFRLEYTEAAGSCADSTGWTRLDTAADAFAIVDSPNLTNGANTTNIGLATGGVTDENSTFLVSNGGQTDTSDTTGAIALLQTEFVDIEYALQATAAAVEGTTYCFRLTNASAPLAVHTVYPRVTINADVSVTALGAHTATVDAPQTAQYLGGGFAIADNVSSHTISSITLTETGTIDASTGLANVALYYDLDTTSPYDCQSESYDGTEPQFGATDTDGFSGANGTSTFVGAQAISTSQAMCVYVVADVTIAAVSGDTVQYSLASPAVDVVAGASVSPSASVTIAGSTTVQAASLTQAAYHWRADDGSESGASSLTSGAENTPLLEFGVAAPLRLRLAVSNDGATTSPAAAYELQYGARTTTCDAVGAWTAVEHAPEDAWDSRDSSFVTHGANTTNIAVSTGGVSDPTASFVGTAGVRETPAVSATTTVAQNAFLELEFSLTSTLATAYGQTYCFRVVRDGQPLNTYTNYPELTMAAKRDYKTQRGTTIINGGTTATIVAGTDYVAPAAPNTAFIRISNTHHTGAGDIVGGGAQDVEEITAYIQNPDNLATSITFARDRNLNETYIDWEIIEFIGEPGTDNELIVREAGTITAGVGDITATATAVAGVSDASDVVVFITGVSGNETGNDLFSTQFTAAWDATSSQPVFTRGATSGADADISYAVVEFTGQNWQVQRVEHTYTAADAVETESITPVAALTQTFLHTQKRVGANSFVASHGHEVYLSSIGAVAFKLAAGADMAVEHASVAWVIENLQTGEGAMRVERQNGTTRNGAEPLTISLTIADTLEAVNNSSIFGSSAAQGTNNAHPRSIAGLRIMSPSSYQLWRSDTGSNLFYRVELVQWPVANLAYRQNYYRWYTNNEALTPTDAWPAGAADLGENTSITATDAPPGTGEVLRLRMTIQARNANWPSDFAQFRLQFAERISTCTAIGSWTNVGAAGSAAIWRGVATTSTTDGAPLSADPPPPGELLLSVADVAGQLVHQNDTASNTYRAFDGEDVEYDWYLQHNAAPANTAYCFRVVQADGTALSSYLQYPQLRTANFTPVIGDWRWYEDAQTETPTTPAAAANVAPPEVAASTSLALRVVVPEIKNVLGTDVKFKLQVSEEADFSTVADVTSTAACTATSSWCYEPGPVPDNTSITTATQPSAGACVASAGPGCGTHNTAPAYVAGHAHGAGVAQEYSFIVTGVQLRPNAVYYFRLFDIARSLPVAHAAGGSYPSVVGEGAALTLSVSGLPSSTSTAGITTTATTTPTAIDFGSLPVGADALAAQRITVDTNALEGYRVWQYARQQLTSGGGVVIPSVSSTNAIPASWAAACLPAESGCVGYHTTDATLSGGSARFAPTDTYARLHTDPAEIMYSSLPAVDSHDVVFRVRVTPAQPAGQYETDIVYIATPVY